MFTRRDLGQRGGRGGEAGWATPGGLWKGGEKPAPQINGVSTLPRGAPAGGQRLGGLRGRRFSPPHPGFGRPAPSGKSSELRPASGTEEEEEEEEQEGDLRGTDRKSVV